MREQKSAWMTHQRWLFLVGWSQRACLELPGLLLNLQEWAPGTERDRNEAGRWGVHWGLPDASAPSQAGQVGQVDRVGTVRCCHGEDSVGSQLIHFSVTSAFPTLFALILMVAQKGIVPSILQRPKEAVSPRSDKWDQIQKALWSTQYKRVVVFRTAWHQARFWGTFKVLSALLWNVSRIRLFSRPPRLWPGLSPS